MQTNPEVQALVSQSEALKEAHAVVVYHDEAEILTAAEQLQLIQGKVKELNAQRLSMTRPLDASKKEIMAFFKVPLDNLASAASSIKAGILEFQTEQERVAREAAEKAAAEEEARQRRNAEARAKRAEKKGDEELAAEIRDEADATVVPVVHKKAPVKKVSGISRRTVWKHDVYDLMELVRAVAAGKAPITMLQADDAVCGQMARSLKDTMSFPGVRFYSEKSLSSGSK